MEGYGSEKVSEAVGVKRRSLQFDLTLVRKILLHEYSVTYWVSGRCPGESLWPSHVLEGCYQTSERIDRTVPFRVIALGYCVCMCVVYVCVCVTLIGAPLVFWTWCVLLDW